ncbi:hypothetical protein QEN19_003198 [Hanseniaspora menglaensis]
MSDDMLLLNIDTSSSNAGVSKSSKIDSANMKGNWKQKRQQVKQLRKNNKTNNVDKNTSKANFSESGSMVNVNDMLFQNKNIKIGRNNNANNKAGAKKGGNPNYKGKGGKNDQTFVSSLFSSNKDIVTKIPEKSVDEKPKTIISEPEVNETEKNDVEDEEKGKIEEIEENKSLSETADATETDVSGFVELGIDSFKLIRSLQTKLKITNPTKIQKLAIPKILNPDQKNVFIHSKTGSGKTLTYMLPIYQTILKNINTGRKSGCTAIIITPTRELSTQLQNIINNSLNIGPAVQAVVLIGGEKKQSEKKRLRKGFNILIGTPGRLLDHFKTTASVKEYIQQSSLKYLVLDEGDRLMELGFQKDLKEIFNIVKDDMCQGNDKTIKKVLCSATTGKDGKLGEFINLKDYQMITANNNEDELDIATSKISEGLVQDCVIVPPKLRLVSLAGVINNTTLEHSKSFDQDGNVILRTMIFLSCSDSVDFHYNIFSSCSGNKYINRIDETISETKMGNTVFPSLIDEQQKDVSYVFYKLHGSLTQNLRTKTLAHFGSNKKVIGKASKIKKHLIMFCTDVASRGLDLPHITKVIEYDPPFTLEDHIHRVGRTARLTNNTDKVKGEATIFLLPGEEEGYLTLLNDLHNNKIVTKTYEAILKRAFTSREIKRNDYDSKSERKGKNGKDKESSWDSNVTTWHMNVERAILEKADLKQSATNGFISHIRAYTTHIAKEKKYFNVKFIHLGHLCKAFGLREKPKQLSYSGNTNKKPQRKRKFGELTDSEDQFNTDSDDEDYKKENKLKNMTNKNKMFEMARIAMKNSASEFQY